MANTNENSFGLMYQSMCDVLGTSPNNFQLITPPSEWNWNVGNLGETYSAQQSFLNAMPIWSAVGKYQSGTSFSEAYRTWLNILVIEAEPELENRITIQYAILQDATNEYQKQYNSAMAAYKAEVPNNEPTFSTWLDSMGGRAYKTKVDAAWANVEKQEELYVDLVNQANDPIVKGALNAYMDQNYYTSVISNAASTFKAPGYGDVPSFAQWVTQNAGGSAVTISWNSSQSSSVFEKSFAGGSGSVGNWFYSVKVGGSWERVETLETSSSLEVEITFQPWGRIPITPLPWYSEATIKAKAYNKDAYRAGYAPYKSDGQPSWMFGEGGLLAARPTDMLVAYQPSFRIKTASSYSSTLMEKFNASTGVRIGPFTFGGSGGSETHLADKYVTGTEFSAESTSQFPVIIGVELDVLGNP